MDSLHRKRQTIVFFVTMMLALVLAGFRTYLLLNFIEPDTGFYATDTRIYIVFNILCCVLVAVVVAGAFICRKMTMPAQLSSESTTVVFSASLCGFLFATVFVYGIYKLVTDAKPDIFLAIETLLCIPCAVCFAIVCIREVRKRSAKQTLLALSPAVYFAVKTIDTFVDTSTQINISQRSLSLVALCAMMLFFVCEAGFVLPNGDQNESGRVNTMVKYYVLGTLSVSFALVAILPYIIVCAFWVYSSEFVIVDVLTACVGLYAATRVVNSIHH